VAIQSVAEHQQLGFLPLADEQYDFVSPVARSGRSAVVAFQQLLNDPGLREQLTAMGLRQDLAGQTS
jgi:putative molybdopterin biosynthesis protein